MSIFRKFLLSFLAIIFSCIAIEFLLQYYQPFGFRMKGQKIILPQNTSITYELQPTDKLDQFSTVTKNSVGFRGKEPPSYFNLHLTLVTIGGSTTESIVINEGKTWTDVLGQKIENNFSKVWINNAGLDGHSTFGHLVLLNDYIISLKPKYALFLIGANDLALFEGREWDVLQPKVKTSTFEEWLTENSEIVALYKNLQRKKATEDLGLKSTEIVDFNNVVKSIEQYPDYKVLGESTASASLVDIAGPEDKQVEYLEAFQLRLETLIEESRRNNIKPVLMTQPAVYGNAIDDVTGADLAKMKISASNGEYGEGVTGIEKWQFLESYNQITRKVATDQNVLLVDLAEKLPKSSRYFYDFIHFSNEGSEKVAEIIYRELCPYLWENSTEFRVTSCTQ